MKCLCEKTPKKDGVKLKEYKEGETYETAWAGRYAQFFVKCGKPNAVIRQFTREEFFNFFKLLTNE